ncbi:hypothetical protein [Merdibacter massiliensis]|uniref:hypothetical protein n=1 Tax=Merdibacter massiliensis TaxID=1871030 RepID=UPI00096A2331|nr:hypothetical protein [Merdibacter massiliensis]
MDFLNMPGFTVFYYLILVIVWLSLIMWLVRSASNSLKRTGGKISSVIDEIAIGIVVSAGFLLVGSLPPTTVFNFLKTPITWIFDLVLQILRFVGVKV